MRSLNYFTQTIPPLFLLRRWTVNTTIHSRLGKISLIEALNKGPATREGRDVKNAKVQRIFQFLIELQAGKFYLSGDPGNFSDDLFSAVL